MDCKSITPDELEQMIHRNSSLVIIDVREPKELATFGCIPHSINSASGINQLLTIKFQFDKGSGIAVVC
jgi:rhodanese-related sulfurtransferase